MDHVPYHDLEQVVRFLASDEIAFLDFRVLPDIVFEPLEPFGGMPVHTDLYQRHEFKSKLSGVEKGDPFENDPGFFQRLDPTQAGRR